MFCSYSKNDSRQFRKYDDSGNSVSTFKIEPSTSPILTQIPSHLAVLSLLYWNIDQTQIRRVSLPRIADASGNISYDELVGLVLVFSLPEEDSSRVNTSNYSVSLTYYDDEKDLITLASTDELKEAIELFADEKFVRITTSVKRKTPYSPAPSTPKHYVQDSTNQSQSPEDPPMKAVLESFAGILSTAVSSLQEGLAKQSPDSPSGNASQLKPPPAPAAKTPKERSPKTGCKNQKGLRAGNKADKATCTKSATSASTSVKEPEKKPPVASGDKKKEPVDSLPFIHGRHTCDGCLTTPIIGKRYHATNLPDYDLCQKCFDNYKGSEIKYEPVELPRDHHFQSQWRTRQETNARIMAMRRSARSSWNRPYVPPRTCPTTRKSPSPPRDSNTVKTNHNVADTVPTRPARHDNALDFGDFEDSLKEAIRRSLDDATKKAKETEKIIAKEVQNIEQQAAVIEKWGAEFQQACVEKWTKTVTDEASEPNIEKVPTSPVEKMSDTTNDIPRSVDIIENNTADVERLENSDAMSEKASVSLEVEDEETLQNAMDTESVDSEKLVSDPSEGEVLPTATDILSPSSSSKQKGLNTPKNESFASDAVGSGDIAEVMGKTLDMVAGVISEMLEEPGEMEGIVREILEDSGEIVESSEVAKESNEDADAESSPGEIIVNSDDDVSEADEGEDDADWSVVKSIGSNGTTESRKIGRATEMLGSALFNSDMKSSAEGVGSNSMQSDSSFSVPSSVPTELGTVTSRPATTSPASKWVTELQKLKELGFDDEECCIGALERVKSDSKTNGIDMELVVNQLLFLNS